MYNYRFEQFEADNVLFSTYAVLRKSGYSGSVAIETADTDAYVVAAVMLCIKIKQGFCRGLVTYELADCIVQLH